MIDDDVRSVHRLLLFAPADTGVYVSPTGSDLAPGSRAAPVQTLARGAQLVTVGRTLWLFPGTYAEGFEANLPSNVTVRAITPLTAILQPTGAHRGLYFAGAHDVTVRDLVLDGASATLDTCKIAVGSARITLLNCEIRNSANQGILIATDAGPGHQITNCHIHHNGVDGLTHGVYVETADCVIDGCTIHDGTGYGVHIYEGTPDRAIVRNNTIYSNARHGIGVYSGTGIQVYNNILYGNNYGIDVDLGATDAHMLNNTSDGNTNSGIHLGPGCVSASIVNDIGSGNGFAGIYVDIHAASPAQIAIQNCLLVGNGTGDLVDSQPTATQANNRIGGAYTAGYANQAGRDYHLTGASSAIGAGQTRAEFATDKDGKVRGAAWDAGAYQT